ISYHRVEHILSSLYLIKFWTDCPGLRQGDWAHAHLQDEEMKQLMVSSLLCSSRHCPGPEPLLATCILTACSKILLPVCRNLLSFLRGTCSLSPSHLRTLGKQLDHNLTFHKLVAYITCLHTAIHITTHLFNFERYSRSRQATDGSLASILSNLSHQEKDSWLNPIQSSNTVISSVQQSDLVFLYITK
uniref:NADPH oxidase 1 n=1 Tax=Balaenoptera musculus TaxID=9771 RepID=A0A8C0I5M9_BALMU